MVAFVRKKWLDFLKKQLGSDLKIHEDDDEDDEEPVDYFQTEFAKEMEKRMHPGIYTRVYRENLGWTQAQLGQKIGVSKSYVCDLEKGRKEIGAQLAKRLAKLFDRPLERFLGKLE